MNIFGNIVSGVTQLGANWLKNKAAEKEAMHQAKLEIIKNNADWESKMASATASSWKDEYLVLLLTSPMFFIGYAVAVDDPTIIDRVKTGFIALSELPDFYQYMLFIAVSSSFGIKGADKLMNLRKK